MPARKTGKKPVFAGQSESTTAFSHPGKQEVTQPVKHKVARVGHGDAEFEGMSEFKAQYLKWPMGDRQMPIKPLRRKAFPDTKFEAKTTSQEAFADPVPEPPQHLKPAKAGMSLSKAPFAGTTETKSKYIKWPIEGTASQKPSGRQTGFLPGKFKFEGESQSQLDYVRHVSERTKPCVPKKTRFLSRDPFEGETEASAQFVKYDGGDMAMPPQRLEQRPLLNKPKLDDQTTSRLAFAPPADPAPARLVRPRGGAPIEKKAFEGMSETQEKYRKWDCKPQSLTKPQFSKALVRKIPFEATSTSSDAFQPPQNVQPTKKVFPASGMKWQKHKFAGESESQAAYRHPGDTSLPKIYKQSSIPAAPRHTGPFVGITTSSSDFAMPPQCPAATLPQPGDNKPGLVEGQMYKYSHQDPSGHFQYVIQ